MKPKLLIECGTTAEDVDTYIGEVLSSRVDSVMLVFRLKATKRPLIQKKLAI